MCLWKKQSRQGERSGKGRREPGDIGGVRAIITA